MTPPCRAMNTGAPHACDTEFGLAVATWGHRGSWWHSPGDTGRVWGQRAAVAPQGLVTLERVGLDGGCERPGSIREWCLLREVLDMAREKDSTS